MTKLAFRRGWFWLRMTVAMILFSWAIGISPNEGVLWLLGEDGEPPAWTRKE